MEKMLRKLSKYDLRSARVEIPQVKNCIINVKVANTAMSRMQGLSGQQNLPEGEGLLLDFGQDESVSLWMPDMYFNLSAAFISSDGRIVGITNMSKDQPFQSHSSPAPVRYALEVPEGFFEKHGVKVGDTVSIVAT